MAIQLFGFQIGRKEDDLPATVQSFAPPPNTDGAINVTEGGAFGTTVDLDGAAKNEASLVTKYREMAQQSECDKAVDDVCNEAIVFDDTEGSVNVILDDIKQPESIKKRIREEFDEVLGLLKFNNQGYDIFRNWYVDGRIYYHIMIDTKTPREGIKELRYVDPRKIKKLRIERKNASSALQGNKQVMAKKYDEYFVYSSRGVTAGNEGIKISPDSIAFVHSGVMDERNSMVLSHLNKAVKPLNQLRMLEDATVIYRLARAPERRIFYIDVGNLPKAKAEQYLRDMMVKHKNKLVYDANSGEVRDSRKHLTMLEDYWLPRREGSNGTEITTLPGGQNLGEMDDVEYFRRKMYESLNVPVSRLESDGQFNVGRSSEITRDEVKFSKFIGRLRSRFAELFYILLEKQLLLKGVITRDEWAEISKGLRFDFLEDNHFTELKEAEVLRERLSLLSDVDQFVGKYYSEAWIRKNVLKQAEDEIETIDKEIEDEGSSEIYEEYLDEEYLKGGKAPGLISILLCFGSFPFNSIYDISRSILKCLEIKGRGADYGTELQEGIGIYYENDTLDRCTSVNCC